MNSQAQVKSHQLSFFSPHNLKISHHKIWQTEKVKTVSKKPIIIHPAIWK